MFGIVVYTIGLDYSSLFSAGKVSSVDRTITICKHATVRLFECGQTVLKLIYSTSLCFSVPLADLLWLYLSVCLYATLPFGCQNINQHQFLLRDAMREWDLAVVRCLLWLAGWVSVTFVYCVETRKSILKPFQSYRVVHQPISRGFAVFADAWLSGWLAEISADLREAVAH